jgi:hypothetical protein
MAESAKQAVDQDGAEAADAAEPTSSQSSPPVGPESRRNTLRGVPFPAVPGEATPLPESVQLPPSRAVSPISEATAEVRMPVTAATPPIVRAVGGDSIKNAKHSPSETPTKRGKKSKKVPKSNRKAIRKEARMASEKPTKSVTHANVDDDARKERSEARKRKDEEWERKVEARKAQAAEQRSQAQNLAREERALARTASPSILRQQREVDVAPEPPEKKKQDWTLLASLAGFIVLLLAFAVYSTRR